MHLIPLLLSLSLALAIQTAPAGPITKVCFTRGEFIYLKDMKTGLERRIVKGSYPNLSPDGKTLAISVDQETRSRVLSREIKLIDLATGKVTDFVSLKKYLCYGAVWAPDGKKIAFGLFKDNQWVVAMMDVESRDWRVLTENLNKVVGVSVNSWTSDSKSLFCQDLDNIYQIGIDGAVLKKIPVADVVDDISYISSLTKFSLSSDGRSLLFDTGEQPDDPRPPMVWIYDLQTRTRKRISGKTLGAYNPQWSPSGDEIIFTAVPLAKGRKNIPAIYRMRKDGTQVQLLVANAELGSVAE